MQAVRKAWLTAQGSALGLQLKLSFALLALPLAGPSLSSPAKQGWRSSDAPLRHAVASPVLLGEEGKWRRGQAIYFAQMLLLLLSLLLFSSGTCFSGKDQCGCWMLSEGCGPQRLLQISVWALAQLH